MFSHLELQGFRLEVQGFGFWILGSSVGGFKFRRSGFRGSELNNSGAEFGVHKFWVYILHVYTGESALRHSSTR